MLDRFSKLLFIDLETTGANLAKDGITEIGIVEVTSEGVQRWSTLVNPQVPIPPFVQQLTGIDDAMVADAPTFDRVMDELQQRLQGSLFIAHNARFDYGFLRHAYKRHGIQLRCDVLCTVKLSRKLYPLEIRHSLDALVERHALKSDTRHRALADADLLWQLWRKLEAAMPVDRMRDAIELQLAKPNLPVALESEQLDDLPDGAGVYVFYGEHDVPLYVGRASNLRQRVLAHFPAGRATYKDAQLARQVRRLEWRETAGDVGAHLQQLAMNRALRPVHETRPQEDGVWSWRLRRDAAGGATPELVHDSDIDFGTAPDLFGLYPTREKAESALRSLAEKNALCLKLTHLETVAPGKPCSGYRARRCTGACIGIETSQRHALRLEHALSGVRVEPWPYRGPAAIIETASDGRQDVHIVDNWSYLGTARAEDEIWHLLDETASRPRFDADVYRLLQRALAKGKLRVRPLAAEAQRAALQSG
ncbi:ethanolamine utilization protein [Oxalobacteraceae bacterium OM1]|nr:ethanolamine utilization protein [Oxalobacteraceae bacterium OM1]